MRLFWTKLRTAFSLGSLSLWRAFSYKVSVRIGLNSTCRIKAAIPQGFFKNPLQIDLIKIPEVQEWNKSLSYFGWYRVFLEQGVPDWHQNPLTKKTIENPLKSWWRIPDFNPEVGDIKTIWEASRFGWVVQFALQFRAGEIKALDRLNLWLADWCQHNPPYQGPNWKCGQEASMRVMNLALAAILLKQVDSPNKALQDLLHLHLQRIAPTIRYALAQNNNHGTSEAAALFIGGSWLSLVQNDSASKEWEQTGRYWLEERVCRLVATDGSFSQYSTNYHRLLLDTLSIAEIWRCTTTLRAFSNRFMERSSLAVEWLYSYANQESGDVPNLGYNDGVNLFPIGYSGGRDFRPSVQLGAALFLDKKAYLDEDTNYLLHYFGVPESTELMRSKKTCLFDQGEYAKLSCEVARLFVIPAFGLGLVMQMLYM